MSLKFGSNPCVRIDLQPGVYLLPVDSAIGKSYMCQIFKDISSIARVASHTFPDAFDAKKVLDNSKRDVVMLDRYDMCDADFSEDMRRFTEKGILLVDFKKSGFPVPARRCRVYMTSNELVVK